MSIAFVVGAGARSTNNNSATTSGVDSTGANFTTIIKGDFDVRASESDSKGNTYTGLTAQENTSNRGTRIYICENATVGSGHTATVSATLSYPCVIFGAFSGVATSSAFDQQNGAKSTSLLGSFQPGSVTPSQNNELVIYGVCHSNSNANPWPAASGYTQIAAGLLASANSVGLSAAYQIQTTATATNPSVSNSPDSSQIAMAIATFKEAAAAAATQNYLTLLGVG